MCVTVSHKYMFHYSFLPFKLAFVKYFHIRGGKKRTLLCKLPLKPKENDKNNLNDLMQNLGLQWNLKISKIIISQSSVPAGK